MLHLPNDHAPQGMTLDAYLAQKTGPSAVVAALAAALPGLAARLAAGRLYGNPAATVGVNDSGDKQKAMDVASHHYVIAALKGAGVRLVLSEEADELTEIDPEGAWDLAMDPIDGSGSIGIGAPLGLFFAIFPAKGTDLRRHGREIVAAGYASFGHSMDFGISMGEGVDIFGYDPATGTFHMTVEQVQLAREAKVLAYNASNEGHWAPGLQAWASDVRAGKSGPRGRDFNMRWLGAAAGDLHRILLEGGAFLYPADRRKGYENGRLRLAYECFPMAYLVEQAGGKASNGTTDILDLTVSEHHQHSALIFGAADEVERIVAALAG